MFQCRVALSFVSHFVFLEKGIKLSIGEKEKEPCVSNIWT